MDNKDLIALLEKHLELIRYYKPFLRVVPGIQEPDCSMLFQAELDVTHELIKLKGDGQG